MPGNVLNIKFNEDLVVNGYVLLSGIYQPPAGSPISFSMEELWVTLRNAPNKVTTGTPTAIIGERSAINFVQAFMLDYNNTNNFSVTRVGNVVTITALNTNITGYTFDLCYALKQFGVAEYADVEFTFGHQSTLNFEVKSITFLPASGIQCTHVNVSVITSVTATEALSPVDFATQFPSGINTNPFVFLWGRGSALSMKIKNGLNQELVYYIQTPAQLSANNYTVTVNNSPNGATLIITYVNQYLVIPQYSLDGVTYQSSNTFSGIAPGTYNLRIKDQFGCIKQKQVIVAEIDDNRQQYFHISKSMSIRFANRVTWGDSANYKNDENTLSCEVDVPLPYKEIQQFQTSDVITTQFKSGYAENTATIIKSDGVEIDVPVQKMSNNVGVKDKRDAIKVNLGGGKIGIYFQTGNIYDYDTGVDTGDYALNGNLPYWATFGNYFSIDNVWYQIDQITFSDLYNSDMIIVDGSMSGTTENVIVGCIYNLFPYEVYEFVIDMVDYQNQNIRVRINNDDEEFGSLVHLSEKINVKIRQQGTIEIRYSNPQNTDVFYSTGITNLIRLPLTKKGGIPDGTNETLKTDTTVVLLSSDMYEGDQFIFEPVTKEIMRKLIQALYHKNVSLDGVYYVISAQPEIEGPLEDTNLYVVKANMLKAAGPFNSDLSSGGNLFDTSEAEIIGLIDIGDGSFIEYT